jgi:hypothetical protein
MCNVDRKRGYGITLYNGGMKNSQQCRDCMIKVG